MSDMNKLVNKILEGADVRRTLSEVTISGLGLDDLEIDPFRNGGHDGDYMELPNGIKISSSDVLDSYIDPLGKVLSLRDIVTPTRKALNFIDVGAKDMFLPNQNELNGNRTTTTYISVEVDGKEIGGIGQGTTQKRGVRNFWVKIDAKAFYYPDTKSIVETVYTEFLKGLNKTLQSLYSKDKKSISVTFHIGSVGYDYKTISCRWSPDTGFVLD